MTVRFTRDTAGAAPLLLASAAELRTPAAVVLWFHGYGVDSETHRKELEQLACEGVLAVGVDAAGHGRRRLPDLDALIAATREDSLRTAASLAAQTAAEVPSIIAHLTERHGADPARVALAGISMGGYVVYRAVVEHPHVRAAVALLGSPEWPHPGSPHDHLDAFARTALLSITAERDENVPPAAARRLHQRLGETHPAADHRYIELAGGVHLMSAAHWEITIGETLRWLREHIAG